MTVRTLRRVVDRHCVMPTGHDKLRSLEEERNGAAAAAVAMAPEPA